MHGWFLLQIMMMTKTWIPLFKNMVWFTLRRGLLCACQRANDIFVRTLLIFFEKMRLDHCSGPVPLDKDEGKRNICRDVSSPEASSCCTLGRVSQDRLRRWTKSLPSLIHPPSSSCVFKKIKVCTLFVSSWQKTAPLSPMSGSIISRSNKPWLFVESIQQTWIGDEEWNKNPLRQS